MIIVVYYHHYQYNLVISVFVLHLRYYHDRTLLCTYAQVSLFMTVH
jgi:hypothetical protein